MSAPDDAPLLRHAPATVQGRYLVRAPRGAARHHLIGFHGYAQTADDLIESFAGSAPDDWLVVAVQALHPFYTRGDRTVVASWMTRLDRERAIAANVGYVDEVVERLEREFGAPRLRAFAGFSQGAGMAYRAGALGRHACAAIVTMGGDVPPELAQSPPTRGWPVVLAMAGASDPAYAPAALARDADALRAHGAEVRALTVPGGHAWSAEVRAATAALLAGLDGR